MAFDEAVAAVIRARLAVVRIIDESAELSFMESARFRLELLGVLKQFDDGTTTAAETVAALEELHGRVDEVVRAGSRVGIS